MKLRKVKLLSVVCGMCGARAIFTEKEGIAGRLADEGWIRLSENNPLCPYCAGIKTQEGFFRILENMGKMGGK